MNPAATPNMSKRAYSSAEVARILGISVRTLYRMLIDGRMEEPMRDPSNGYRIWTEYDVRKIQESWPVKPAR